MKCILMLFITVSVYATSFHQDEKFIRSLKTLITVKKKQKNFGNVLQGICFIDKKGNMITSQSKKDKFIVINILNNKGKSTFSQKIEYASHAQDLSYYKDKKKKLHILTTGEHWYGVVDFILENKKFHFYAQYRLSIGKNTPSISEDKKYLITKANNSIYVYRFVDLRTDVEAHPLYSFVLDEKQRGKRQWTQGVAMKDNYIYVLSGDNTFKVKKYVVVYDAYGHVLKRMVLSAGKEEAKIKGKKWEMEGLTFLCNKLYTSVMSGEDGHNKKALYKLLEVE